MLSTSWKFQGFVADQIYKASFSFFFFFLTDCACKWPVTYLLCEFQPKDFSTYLASSSSWEMHDILFNVIWDLLFVDIFTWKAKIKTCRISRFSKKVGGKPQFLSLSVITVAKETYNEIYTSSKHETGLLTFLSNGSLSVVERDKQTHKQKRISF